MEVQTTLAEMYVDSHTFVPMHAGIGLTGINMYRGWTDRCPLRKNTFLTLDRKSRQFDQRDSYPIYPHPSI